MQLKLIEYILYRFIFLFSYNLLYLKSPVYLRLSLILIALITRAFLWVYVSKWPALALRLIFVGGMMIIFLYIRSLSANFKTLKSFNYNWKSLVLFIFVINRFWIPINSFKVENIYSWNNHLVFTFLILYLLLTLILVRKLSQSFKGPLIEKFF